MAVVSLYGKMVLGKVKLWGKLIAAFLPAAVIGLGFYSVIKKSLLDNPVVTLTALLVGGVILIGLEKWVFKKKTGTADLEKVTYKQAVVVGCFQALAVIPGVSRAGATIVGGMLNGLNRKAAVELSFLLAVPTMAAATGLDLLKTRGQFNKPEYLMLGVGFIGAWLTAMVAVRYFVKFVEKHTLAGFGVYRILLALVYGLWFWAIS